MQSTPAAGSRRSASWSAMVWIDRHPSIPIAVFAVVVAVLARRAYQRLDVPGAPDSTHWVMQDFRDAVYWPAVAFLDGVNPYDTPRYEAAYPVGAEFPLYSPLALLLHAPLALLPYRVAEAVYFAGCVILIPVLAFAVLRWCKLEVTWGRVFALAALVQLTRPAYSNLLGGQVALPMVLGSWAALHWARRRPGMAGLGLALASVKPTFAVPLGLMMLCRRDFRAVATGAVVGGMGAAIGAAILIARRGDPSDFVQSLVRSHAAFEAEIAASPIVGTMRCDALATVARLLHWDPGSVGKLLVPLAIWTLCGAAIATLSRNGRRRADYLSGAITCLVILVSVYHLAYDAVLVVLPLTAVAAARRGPWRALPTAGRVAIGAAMSVPCWNYLGTYEALRWFHVEQGQSVWAAATAMNGLSLLAALAACLLVVVSGQWSVVSGQNSIH